MIEVKLTKKQSMAMNEIKKMEEHFGIRWFTQAELYGITLHTMKALVEKKLLDVQVFAGLIYYKLIRRDIEV